MRNAIGPMFKWFGSKWRTAARYPAPEHDHIVEPFAGGCGYALNYAHLAVTLWDEDPLIAELWRWLIGTRDVAAAIMAIPVGLPAGTDIRTITSLDRGQQLLLKCWQKPNPCGDTTGAWRVSSWGDAQWTTAKRARVAADAPRISHWRVARPDPDLPATWFCDPPYEFNYRYSARLPAFNRAEFSLFVDRIHPDSLVIVCEALGPNDQRPTYLPFEFSHLSSRHAARELQYVRRPACVAVAQ